jgi:hypothetical protein
MPLSVSGLCFLVAFLLRLELVASVIGIGSVDAGEDRKGRAP